MTHFPLKRLAILLLALLAIGCGSQGPKIVPVSGNVKLDGKPIAGAAVVFTPAEGGRPAIGTTDEQGDFQLTTLKKNDGALEGPHAVTVTKVEVTGVEAGEDGLSGHLTASARQTWIVPQKYSRQDTSGLTADVAAEMNRPVFELKSGK